MSIIGGNTLTKNAANEIKKDPLFRSVIRRLKDDVSTIAQYSYTVRDIEHRLLGAAESKADSAVEDEKMSLLAELLDIAANLESSIERFNTSVNRINIEL